MAVIQAPPMMMMGARGHNNLAIVGFQTVGLFIFITCLLACLVLAVSVVACRFKGHRKRANRAGGGSKDSLMIAFFHPYCSGGGGGERVLWKIVEVILQLKLKKVYPKRIHVLIYTLDEPSSTYTKDVLGHVKDRFSIDLTGKELDATASLTFVHLHSYRHYLLPAKRFSLIVESFRTMQLAWAALTYSWDLMPDIFMDTTGCAFTFSVANLLMGCKVWAYVHYPTISTDMLQLVWQQRRAAYNHSDYIAKSKLATYAKMAYYCVFAFCYGLTGGLAQVVLVNSTWTFNHITYLWKFAAWRNRIEIVYPPCQVVSAEGDSLRQPSKPRQNVILSIGQFRPEKDHVLQIEALACFLESYPEWKGTIKLVLIGSCRGDSDRERLNQLQTLAHDKHQWTTDTIEFVVNEPNSVVQDWLSKSSMGIHTMWNEHFGIGIVEMMAAGLLVIAHNSGGPQTDIVTTTSKTGKQQDRTGFLASTAEEYAKCIHQILNLDKEAADQIRQRAQSSALRFSDEVFAKHMGEIFHTHLPQVKA